jgi:hypothetical protein
MPALLEPRSKATRATGLVFLVPKSFDPRRILRLVGLDASRYRDTARYFMSMIATKTAYGGADDEGYVHLWSEILQKRLPRDYLKVVMALVDAGALDPPSSYSAGRWSKGYRISTRYSGDLCKMVHATDPGIIRRFEAQVKKWEEALLPVHLGLKENLGLLTIEPAGMRIIEELPVDAKLSQSIIASHINQQSRRLRLTSTGRVNTPFTNAARVWRPHVLLDGERMGEVDLACTQPALLAVLANLRPGDKLLTYIEELRRLPVLQGRRTDTVSPERAWAASGGPGLLDATSGGRVSLGSDLGLFSELVFAGEFYEFMVDRCESAGVQLVPDVPRPGRRGSPPTTPRDAVKILMQQEVISKRANYHSAFGRVFYESFPSVLEFIRYVNRYSHSEMVRGLQRLESILVIEHVAPKLVWRKPDPIPILTLHDAVWGRQKDLPVIEDAFHETCDDLGIRLATKCKCPQTDGGLS